MIGDDDDFNGTGSQPRHQREPEIGDFADADGVNHGRHQRKPATGSRRHDGDTDIHPVIQVQPHWGSAPTTDYAGLDDDDTGDEDQGDFAEDDQDAAEDADEEITGDIDEDTDQDADEDIYQDSDRYAEDDQYAAEDADEEADEEIASPRQPNSLKWGLIAVSVLAAVAVVLVAVVLLGGNPGDDASTGASSRSKDASGIASANDKEPVAVIIDDPSCTGWNSISTNLANTLSLLGHGEWNERDQAIPASEWSDELRKGYLAAGQVIRSAAAQTVGLVKLTPHRVMRELYEQFIAYSRTFVEHIPNYTAADATLVGTVHSAASGLAAICVATTNGSAAARGPLVESQSAPTVFAPMNNPTNPQRYLTTPNAVCGDWKATLDRFGADTAEWQNLDPSVPGTFWNPQQKQVNMAAAPVMISYANKLQQLGRRSNNPTLQDFADLSAQYRRAFALALPTYDPSDNYLANAASYVSTTVLGACVAAAQVK